MPRLHNEYRKLWEAEGYSPRCGSAGVVKPPPKEFLRVYHLTTADHAISNIALSRIKIARLKDLNDPFEGLAANFKDINVRERINRFKEDYNKYAGLLCFSSDWISPVMCSHYASRHKGICLGFDLKREFSRKVLYENDRLYLSLDAKLSDSPINETLREILLCTKFKHWEYEQEIRAYVELEKAEKEKDHFFHPIGKELQLREVILGVNCPISLGAIKKLTDSKYPNVATYKARLADKFFSIVPDETTIPG